MDGADKPLAEGAFAFNRPVIVAALAYVWRKDAREGEASHYRYLIRTFWLGLLAAVTGILLLGSIVGLIGEPRPHPGQVSLVIAAVCLAAALLLADVVWIGVRSVLSISRALQKLPMPRPETWWF
jgi:uncharacterized membrane protein